MLGFGGGLLHLFIDGRSLLVVLLEVFVELVHLGL